MIPFLSWRFPLCCKFSLEFFFLPFGRLTTSHPTPAHNTQSGKCKIITIKRRYTWHENDFWVSKNLIVLMCTDHTDFLLDILLPVKFHFVLLSEFWIPSPPRSPRWKWSSWRPPRSWLRTWCVLTITTTTITTTITITNFYICQKRKEIKNVLVIVMANSCASTEVWQTNKNILIKNVFTNLRLSLHWFTLSITHLSLF